jgi:hypothetical protein
MSRVREFQEANYRYHNELEWYPGTIVDVLDEDFGYGPTVVFDIQLDGDGEDDEGNPRITKAMASDKLTPNSKLTRWVRGIFGEDAVGPGQVVDLDLATAERVEVMFEYGENKSGDPDEKIVQIRKAR